MLGLRGAIFGAWKAALGGLWGNLGGHLADLGGHLGAWRLARANIIGKEQLFLSKVLFSLGFLIVFDVPGIGLKGNFGSHLGLLGAILKV